MARLSLAKLERHLYAAADILRSKMDAAGYKDFIFGILFLRHCSDVFEAEREKVIAQYNEHVADEPEFYNGFFVPEKARWQYLMNQSKSGAESFGKRLDKALVLLGEHRMPLAEIEARRGLFGAIGLDSAQVFAARAEGCYADFAAALTEGNAIRASTKPPPPVQNLPIPPARPTHERRT